MRGNLSNNTIILVQARMGSSRLPGKVLKEVTGRPLLGFLLERLARVKRAKKIVVATTDLPGDLPIVDYCRKESTSVYCGSETDVLARFYYAAKEHGADVVVRVTGDCPLIDPAIIDLAITKFHNQKCDYLSNTIQRSYPRGMDVEVFSFLSLEKAFEDSSSSWDREHVTPYIYNHPKIFDLHHLNAKNDSSRYRLTVDTADDLTLVTQLIENIYSHNPRFNLSDLLQLLGRHPEWEKINQHVEQKTHTEFE